MSDHSQAVDLAYHCTLFLVEPDATREEAEAAIDNAPKVRTGMSFAVRAAVLERFEPEREPVPFLDFLPVPPPVQEPITDERAQEIVDGLNAIPDLDAAYDWVYAQPGVGVLRGFLSPRNPEVELYDGTVIAWCREISRWEFAVREVPTEAGRADAMAHRQATGRGRS